MDKKDKEPPQYPEIGARLTQFIKDSGEPNARQFAIRAGLSPQLVSHTAAGKSIPGGAVLLALTQTYKNFDSDWLLTGKYKSQLPPAVPSHFEEATPRPGYFKVTADSEEMKQVKDERDNLRRQVDRLLALLENSNAFARPTGTGGKTEASADAATNLYALTDRLCVAGLIRYPETEAAPVDEPAHYDLASGERLAA